MTSGMLTPMKEAVTTAQERLSVQDLIAESALTRQDLAHYVASGEWEGCAGAYAIQGLGASLVERVDGDYLNVVGLPGAVLLDVLEKRRLLSETA